MGRDEETDKHAASSPSRHTAGRMDARRVTADHRDVGMPATSGEVRAFLDKARALAVGRPAARGRLIFAMDATMSRQPTWDLALSLQGEMFEAVAEAGGLDVQLVYFRGLGECRASRWVSDATALARLMTTVDCRGGNTQIGKVLSHARREAERQPVSALVYVGDCMEEGIDDLCGRAGELALLNMPAFMFQEGSDRAAERAFREIARLTGGAWCSFKPGAGNDLKALLRAVATYAAGGRDALRQLGDGRHPDGTGARRLLTQMKPG